MEKEGLYRKKSLESIQSPEQLNDYLHITEPSVWLVLTAVFLLLAGLLVWSSFSYIDSAVYGSARVEQGRMTVRFDEGQNTEVLEPGMEISIGEITAEVRSLGEDAQGVFAVADADLADGVYKASVRYKRTRILKLLFR